MSVQGRVLTHAFAGLRDKAFDGGIHRHHAAVKRAVGRQLEIAPERKLRQDALEHGRENLVEVALNHLFVRLQRVHFGTEGQAGDGVHREAHQVGLQVDGLPAARCLLPASTQPLRDLEQAWKVVFDMLGVEARHHHAPLALPVVAFGTEHAAGHAHFVPHLAQLRGASKAVGPVAQQRADGVVVGHHHELAAGQAEAKQRPVFAAPLLDAGMHPCSVDLQQVAQQRQAARAGQVGDVAQDGGTGRGACQGG